MQSAYWQLALAQDYSTRLAMMRLKGMEWSWDLILDMGFLVHRPSAALLWDSGYQYKYKYKYQVKYK